MPSTLCHLRDKVVDVLYNFVIYKCIIYDFVSELASTDKVVDDKVVDDKFVALLQKSPIKETIDDMHDFVCELASTDKVVDAIYTCVSVFVEHLQHHPHHVVDVVDDMYNFMLYMPSTLSHICSHHMHHSSKKKQVSFAKEPYKRDDILQRIIFLISVDCNIML